MRYAFKRTSVVAWVKDYLHSEFNLKTYLLVGCLAIVLLAFNYSFDFEDGFVDSHHGTLLYPVLFFLSHTIPYVICVFILQYHNNWKHKLHWQFWAYMAFLMTVLSIDRSTNFFHFVYADRSFADVHYLRKSLVNLNGLISMLIPACILYAFIDKKFINHFYGFALRKPKIRPYLWLLIVVAGLALLGTFLPGFGNVYPRFQDAGINRFADSNGIPYTFALLFYEICYLLDFVSIEFFFRGLLIFGMYRFLGKDVVLPMAITYMVLHFGKPMGEAIGSLFGGYFLGILALKGERIWGGIILHMGLALCMEIFSALMF